MINKKIVFQEPIRKNDQFASNTGGLSYVIKFTVTDVNEQSESKKPDTFYSLNIKITEEIRDEWHDLHESDIRKLIIAKAIRFIEHKIQIGLLLKKEELLLSTENVEKNYHALLSNTPDMEQYTYYVKIEEQTEKLPPIHPNIQILINRMNDALTRNDGAGVVHASASIFETMAKDVVNIPTIQNQSLKSFFDRYRKDSKLPEKILDYILTIYEDRNTTPLAGHGSTQTHNISKQAAIALAEMTKAFVRIEYNLKA